MNVIFVSSRARGRQEQQVNRVGNTVNITVPSDLVSRLLLEGAILQLQIGPVPYIRQDYARPTSRQNSGRSPRPYIRQDYARPTSRQNSGRSPRPTSRLNSDRDRPISPFTDWSSIGELPTRLDLEEEEVIAIDDSDNDSDYVPPESMYEPDSPRPEPRGPREEEPEEPRPGPPGEEGPGAPNIFTDSASGRGRGRGIHVQWVNPFSRGRGFRRNILGRVRPM